MLKIIRFILNSVLVSECLEEGDWSPVEGRCPTQLDLMASSAWAVITISVLVVVILLLLSCLLWLQGYDRLRQLLAQKKPSLMSQGVSTRNINSNEISQFRASLKHKTPTTTVPSTTSSLSSFYKR